ncbi:FAD/NAD(P)-binding domain-containing protein [Xylariaceae sp. FL0804]|nr:FAD/NAD(P)-binding domain-containing protein [Xylariaceae sp. FL0804]
MTASTGDPGNGARTKKLHFVIVGGSLGGLAAGLALKALGHDTTILERNTTPLLQDQGAGIVAGGDRLDFLPTLQPRRPPARRGLQGPADMIQNMTSWDLVYHLMRANYDGVASPYCDVPPPDPAHGRAVHLHDRDVTDVRLEEASSEEESGEGDGVRVFWTSSAGEQGSARGGMVVGADGPSSTVRGLLQQQPAVERTNATHAALAERFTFFHAPGVQMLTYLPDPGPPRRRRAQRAPHQLRLLRQLPPRGSPSLERLMTDREGPPPRRHHAARHDGRRRRGRPSGGRRAKRLPPPFAEVGVRDAGRPFVQAVTDVLSPDHEYLGGRAGGAGGGDALAGLSAAHGGVDVAGLLSTPWRSRTTCAARCRATDECWRRTLGFARLVQRRGVDMGERSQHGGGTTCRSRREHIRDRNVASTPRQQEVYPDWATAI